MLLSSKQLYGIHSTKEHLNFKIIRKYDIFRGPQRGPLKALVLFELEIV